MLTPASRRADFPGLEGIAYFNTAAESIPPRCVGEAIAQYAQDKGLGMRGRVPHFAAVEACREISAKLVGLKTEEVSFCSCSSEAYNLLAGALDLGPDDEVVVSDLDFPAGATPWLRAARPPRVKVWRACQGVLRTEDLLPLLGAKTRLVQVSLVSFYNGFRIDWPALRDAVRSLAPQAVLSADITQAFGRVELDCADADILISSTHKWTLGIHGGCVIGVPEAGAERLTTRAGGWYHLTNAFEADRFEKAVTKPGAASFSVGMPNFVSLYALNASLRYLDGIGIDAISRHADPLVAKVHAGLVDLGIEPLAPLQREFPTGIVSFIHPRSNEIHAALESEEIHVMHQAGRVRVAVHGYNTADEVARLLGVIADAIS
ncbi:MAG: aminotransferase class V-fold PLP-dependent enzyme [Verrucomicrobiales bacterium]|nr:aminotransferase class V-fold PLP-dependent enzyme [Verrucomicrobiales bacterium]